VIAARSVGNSDAVDDDKGGTTVSRYDCPPNSAVSAATRRRHDDQDAETLALYDRATGVGSSVSD